ncbi:MAG: DUF5719 family protein [Acidimicrobiales bacterium]
MRSWRLPTIVVLVGLLVGAVLVEREQTRPEPSPAGSAPDRALPTLSPAEAAGSTWYCAGGTATGTEEGFAEHAVHLANTADEEASARLTVYPSEGEPVARTFALAPHTRVGVGLAELVTAPFAAALVEVSGGGVAVAHEVTGPAGRSVGACASEPSDAWYFPAGTTRAGTRMVLALFNPFPGDAVVDISFDTDDGTRTPQAYQALVVPGRRLLAVDVSEVVTLRAEVATEVRARSGRLIVDQIQSGDGTEGAPRGLSVTLGAPAPAQTWLFPDGVGASGFREWVSVYNPGGGTAEVDVFALLDDPEVNGVAEPFEVSVGARRSISLDILADGRVPVGVAHAIVVRSRNGEPVIAERVVAGGPDAAQPGWGLTIGAPVEAGRWVVPVASAGGVSGAALIVFNPSATERARLTVEALGEGRRWTPDGFGGIELGPGERRILDLGTEGLGVRGLMLVVDSAGPIVAEQRFGFSRGKDLSYLIAVPVRDTLATPSGTVGDLSADEIILGS